MVAEEKGTVEAVVQEVPGNEKDSVRISPDVIAIIAGTAAAEVEGIAGMSGSIVGGIAEKLGRKDLTKGIKVHLEDNRVSMDLNIIVDLGVEIAAVAKKLTQEVRNTVEKITGLKVTAINVHVLGLNIPREQEDKPGKEEEE